MPRPLSKLHMSVLGLLMALAVEAAIWLVYRLAGLGGGPIKFVTMLGLGIAAFSSGIIIETTALTRAFH